MFFTYYSNVNFMPPFGTDAPLTPKGGKYLFIRHLNSFSIWGRMSAGQDGGSLNIA